MIPNDQSFCEIDPVTVDRWGIPVLRFHFKWSQDEILQAKHMQNTFEELITAAGGKVTSKSGDPSVGGISRGGEIIHEVGATKMGDNPKTSVLNQWCQAWDCKNLFITDAAPFASNSDKNPTLSITGAGLAHQRLHRRPDQKEEPLIWMLLAAISFISWASRRRRRRATGGSRPPGAVRTGARQVSAQGLRHASMAYR